MQHLAQGIEQDEYGDEQEQLYFGPDFLEKEDQEIRIRQMYKEISKLKDLDKTIIFLYLEECSYDEIAEITGISTKNVGVRLVRIREKLRKKLNFQNSMS